jgi:hypothetical protein
MCFFGFAASHYWNPKKWNNVPHVESRSNSLLALPPLLYCIWGSKYVFLLFPSIHIYTPCTAKKNSNTKTQHRVVSLSVGFTHGTIMSSKLLLLEGVYGAVINGIVIGDTTKVCRGGEIANKHQLLDLSQD